MIDRTGERYIFLGKQQLPIRTLLGELETEPETMYFRIAGSTIRKMVWYQQHEAIEPVRPIKHKLFGRTRRKSKRFRSSGELQARTVMGL